MPSLTSAEARALGRALGVEPHSGKKSRLRGSTARRKPVQKEREIQRQILDFLGTVPGVVAWKTGGGMFRLSYKGKERMVRIGKVGVSDIVGWASWDKGRGSDGIARFLAIEVKARGGRLTPEQDAFLASVHRAGGIAVLAYSVADVASALGLAPACASSTSATQG
jgi:hypothetical protein